MWGVNVMHLLMFFCILGVFSGGGGFGILEEKSPQEIAGNNTAHRYSFIHSFSPVNGNHIMEI